MPLIKYTEYHKQSNLINEEDTPEDLAFRSLIKGMLDKHDQDHKAHFHAYQQKIEDHVNKLPETPTDEHYKFIGDHINKLRQHPYLRANIGGANMTPYSPEEPVKLGKSIVDAYREHVNNPVNKLLGTKPDNIWEELILEAAKPKTPAWHRAMANWHNTEKETLETLAQPLLKSIDNSIRMNPSNPTKHPLWKEVDHISKQIRNHTSNAQKHLDQAKRLEQAARAARTQKVKKFFKLK